MVSRRTDRLLHKITHHTNKAHPYDKNISGFDYPIQDSEILGREITLRYKNRYIPDKKVSEDEDYVGPDTFEEDDDNDNIDNIYENDFIILRCDQAPPYRFIGISVDYTVILVGDSRTYDDEDIVFKYPKQFEEYLGLYLINEYTNSEQFGEVPSDQIQRLRGVVLSCDSMEPGESVIAEFYDHNRTRFILESEVQSVVLDRYDADGERDYNGIDPLDHGLVYIDLNGKYANSEGEPIYLDANGGYPDPLADMYRKDILSPEEVCELRGRIIEEREIFGLDQIYPREITLNTTSINLDRGETYQLVATIPQTATYNTITWVSSDESIATVDDNGLVSSTGSGKVKIYAVCLDVWARCVVTSTVNVEGINLDIDSIELLEGESQTLHATILPEDASNKKVIWSSSNESVATVTQNGTVDVIRAGEAVITATSEDGGFTATCNVTGISTYVPVESVEVTNYSEWSYVYLSTNEENVPNTFVAQVKILPENATNKEIYVEVDSASTFSISARKRSNTEVEISANCYNYQLNTVRIYSADDNTKYKELRIVVNTQLKDISIVPDRLHIEPWFSEDESKKTGTYILNFLPQTTVGDIKVGVNSQDAYNARNSVRTISELNWESDLDWRDFYNTTKNRFAYETNHVSHSNQSSPGLYTMTYTNPYNNQVKTLNIEVGDQAITRLQIKDVPQDWSQYEPGDEFTVHVECKPSYFSDYPAFYGVINWSVSGNNNNIEITVNGDAQETATIRILSACEDLVVTATSSKFPNMTDSFTMTIEEPYVPVEEIKVYWNDIERYYTNEMSPNEPDGDPSYVDFTIEVLPENATNKEILVKQESFDDSEGRLDFGSIITKLSNTEIRISAISNTFHRGNEDILRVYSVDNENIYKDITVTGIRQRLEDVEFDINPEDLQMGFYEQKQIQVNFFPQIWSSNHIEKIGPIHDDTESVMISLTNYGDTDLSCTTDYEFEVPWNDLDLYGTINIDTTGALEGTETIELNLGEKFDPETGEWITVTKSIEITVQHQDLETLIIEDVPEDYSEFDPVDNNTFTVRVKSDPEWMLEESRYIDIYGYLKWSISGSDVAEVIEEYDEEYPSDCEWTVTAYDSNGLSIVQIRYNTYYPDSYGEAEVTILGPCNNVILTASTSEFPNVTQSFTVNTVGNTAKCIRICSEEIYSYDHMHVFDTGWTNTEENDYNGIHLYKGFQSEFEFEKLTLHVQTYPILSQEPTIIFDSSVGTAVQGFERTDYSCKVTKKSNTVYEFLGYCHSLDSYDSFSFKCLTNSNSNNPEYIGWSVWAQVVTAFEGISFDVSQEDLKLNILYNNDTGKFYINDKTYRLNLSPQYWSANHIEKTGFGPYEGAGEEDTPPRYIQSSGTASGLNIPVRANRAKPLGLFEEFTISSDNITSPGILSLGISYYNFSPILTSINVAIGEQQINSIAIANIPNEINVGDEFDLTLNVNPIYWSQWPSFYGDINWTVTGNQDNIISTSVSNNIMHVSALKAGTVTITAASVKFPGISNSITINVISSIIPVEHIRIYNLAKYIDTDREFVQSQNAHFMNLYVNPSLDHTIELNLEITPVNATDKSINITGINQHPDIGDLCSTLVQISDNKLLATGVACTIADDPSFVDEFTISSVSNPEVSTYLWGGVLSNTDNFEFDITPEDLNIELKYNENTGKYYIDDKIFKVNLSPINWTVNHIVQTGPGVYGDESIQSDITGLSFYYDGGDNHQTYCEYILEGSDISGPGTATLEVTMYDDNWEPITKSITVNIQPPSSYLYDWDFTNSLYDTVNNTPATFYARSSSSPIPTTTPADGQYEQGVGLHTLNYSPLGIPVDLTSKITSYTVEIDFTDFELFWASWCLGFIETISEQIYGNGTIYSGLSSDGIGLSFAVTDEDGRYNWYDTEISDEHYFANSTMKIVTRITENNNVIWDFYKNNVLVFSTPEYGEFTGDPFIFDNSELQHPFAISGHDYELQATITGMRIYETNNN